MASRWWHNLIGGGSVVATLLTVVFVLPALDRAVPADHAAPTQRHEIGLGVSVIPPLGSLIARQSRSQSGGSILFLVGPARYVVAVAPFDGDLPAASVRLKTKIQGMRGYQVTSAESPIRTDSGLPGLGATFNAPGHSGRYAAFVAPGRSIEVTITGAAHDFQHELLSIDESVNSITYGGDGE
ncbi:hypothetical protein [Allorhizocola rhizosphaerae]|uniref:hypothetical protein n=1 Tax=Allorhizocola rhizosphaerae TaxID=1872709 RepID=UPI001FE6EE95|nr:hypothetical protein [Allorhizocola rhizosphaerae]